VSAGNGTAKTQGPFALFGWLDGSLYLIGRALEKLSGGRFRLVKYVFVAQPVSDKPVLSSSSAGSLVVRRTHASDAVVAHFPRPKRVIDWRFADGAICFTATKSDRFVGFLWLHDHPYEEDEVHCLFSPVADDGAAWDYDVYVEPEYRAGRAFVRLWDTAHEYLRARGIGWTMSRISAFNPGSLASHERMGGRRLGSALFLCLGPLQIASATTGPYLSVSWGHRARPRIVLRAPGAVAAAAFDPLAAPGRRS
jgi:GNAT superfamily N-acetyltransferase